MKPLDLDLDSFIDVKGWKSIGNKISTEKIRSGSFKFKERLETKKPDDENVNETDNKENKNDENFEVGESVELDLDSDQLNLFNEKIKIAVDIGNSNVVIGLYTNGKWEKIYRLSTKKISLTGHFKKTQENNFIKRL